ncbi:MAG: molybdate ABC transporter substrate-binding protein [Hungatella sp.]|nr:molybdate ABC transporter substrate-binding protein [Hungatella sp.]
MAGKRMGVMALAVAVWALAGCKEPGSFGVSSVRSQEASKVGRGWADGGAEPGQGGIDVLENQEEIVVAAAASLSNVFEDRLIPMFQEQNQGIRVRGIYDSSGRLQTQLEEGLEADLFISASRKQMEALDEKAMIASETITPLLKNKLVLIVPAGGEAGFGALEDIVKAKSIALGDPDSVPAGQYAKEALMNLGIWDELQDRVSFGTNVTEVLNQVAAFSADAGIVYATDAAGMEGKVTVAAEVFEESLSQGVIYPVAVVKGTAHSQASGRFLEFLKTEEAMAVFEEYGFARGE